MLNGHFVFKERYNGVETHRSVMSCAILLVNELNVKNTYRNNWNHIE